MRQNAFGQPLRRREDLRHLTGTARFLADALPADGVWAEMLRSPHAHADILSIDAAVARALPGVLAVLTGAELAADGISGVPPGADFARFPGTPADQDFAFRPEHPALARDKARFVGDNVAMVIAETPQVARDALELIHVAYRPLPAGTDTASALTAPPVWDGAPDNVCFRWSAGDAAAVDAAFSQAHSVVRLDAINNRIHVGALETRGAVGMFDSATGRYTLHTGTQMPHGLRDALADDVFRVPRENIRVLVTDVGGSFGIKNALYPEQILVLWAARRLGRPVCWIGERADGFLSDYQARDHAYSAELALDVDGIFLALRVNSQANIGAYLAPKGQLSPTANTPVLAGVYRLPDIAVAVTGVFTHTAPTEVYRGAGRPEYVYLLERLVEEAARQTGIDPIALRRRNLLTPADLPYQTALGLRYDSGDFPALLDLALTRADHAGFAGRKTEAATRGKLRGIGLCHYCERVGGSWDEHAWLELDATGRVTVLIGTMSNGQGHETAYAQLVADQLGLDPDDIAVVQGDTDRIPSGRGTGGSASIPIGGAALADAAIDLIRKAMPLATDALEAAAVDVTFTDGAFRVVGTDRVVGMRAVAARLGPAHLGQDGAPARLDGAGYWKPAGPTFPNGCHVAEVEIDPETGETELVAYTMLHDFGRVLNPMMLEGQLQGGVAQGIGQALHEHVVHDAETGQVMSASLMDYRLPRADDLPALELITHATPSPANPLGVKGCGEAGAAGSPPAVMNAVADALASVGVTRIDMPATAQRVWRAIRDAV